MRLVVFSIVFFDKIKIDDPVGAISVHGICGVWGTVAVGIFSFNPDHTVYDATDRHVVRSVVSRSSSRLWSSSSLKLIMGVRVSVNEEEEGLDFGEHGMHAYSGF